MQREFDLKTWNMKGRYHAAQIDSEAKVQDHKVHNLVHFRAETKLFKTRTG
jgi:hypothetical protein